MSYFSPERLFDTRHNPPSQGELEKKHEPNRSIKSAVKTMLKYCLLAAAVAASVWIAVVAIAQFFPSIVSLTALESIGVGVTVSISVWLSITAFVVSVKLINKHLDSRPNPR